MQVLSAKRKPDAPGGGLSLKIRAQTVGKQTRANLARRKTESELAA